MDLAVLRNREPSAQDWRDTKPSGEVAVVLRAVARLLGRADAFGGAAECRGRRSLA